MKDSSNWDDAGSLPSHNHESNAAVGGASLLALQAGIPEFLQETVANIVAFLPRLFGALVILLIGWVIGRIVGRVVTEVVDRVELDRLAMRTPIGRALGDSERAVSRAFGKIAAYYIYLLALVAAADALAIDVLSEWVTTVVSYLPAFVAGVLVIVLGFIVADFVGRAIERSRTASQTRYTTVLGGGARLFLYFTVIVIGLDTMGIDVRVLYILAQAVAYGVGAAIAIGVGVAVGWGGKDYVAANIDRWMGQAKTRSPDVSDETTADD